MAIETWSTLKSGEYKGKTVPEVVVIDPAWFFTQIHRHRKTISDWELLEIGWKATCIAIPKPDPKNWKIGWVINSANELLDFHVVKANDPEENFSFVTDCVNLSSSSILPFIKINQKKMNRKASKRFSDAFRRNYFGGEEATKERCESFFSNDNNFILDDCAKKLFLIGRTKIIYSDKKIIPGNFALA